MYNSQAGKGGVKKIVDGLCRQLDALNTPYVPIEKKFFTGKKARELFLEGKFSQVLVCGGDGTINRAIHLLRDFLPDITIGIIPCGYGNLIDKSLKTSFTLEEFVSKKGIPEWTEIDAGKANGQIFINVVSVGITADTVAFVEKFRDTRPGSVIYRLFGGIATHIFCFFMIQFKNLFFRIYSDYPPSVAWMRDHNNGSDATFSLYSGTSNIIGHYKTLYLEGINRIPWRKKKKPATSDEYIIEYSSPFHWQIDGEPQEKTPFMKINFNKLNLHITSIRQEEERDHV